MADDGGIELLPSPLTAARPFAGLVRFFDAADLDKTEQSFYSLEFFYVTPRDVCSGSRRWDFVNVLEKLRRVQSRGHKSVVRLSYQPIEGELALPEYLLADEYSEETSEGPVGPWELGTWRYASWRNSHFVRFMHEFVRQCALVLDGHDGVAYVQGFVGHWSEGHAWHADGGSSEPIHRGLFPTPAQYRNFLEFAEKSFRRVRVMVGLSTGDPEFWGGDLKQCPVRRHAYFGTFEDTFLATDAATAKHNERLLRKLGNDRWHLAPRGGEVSFHERNRAVQDGDWIREHVRDRHMTFCLAAESLFQAEHAPRTSASFGFDFSITHDRAAESLRVTNTGVAPICYPAYVFVGGVQAGEDLQTLLPNQDLTIPLGGLGGEVHVRCVRYACSREREEVPYRSGERSQSKRYG
jgi:hypothetical protein